MTNIVPRPNSLILGLFQSKYIFRRQRIKVLSLALLTLCLIPGTSPTQPRVKLTAGPMCIEMDGLIQNKNQVSPFECMKCVSLPIQGHIINLSAYINETIYKHFILSLKSSIDGPTTVSRWANHWVIGATTFL